MKKWMILALAVVAGLGVAIASAEEQGKEKTEKKKTGSVVKLSKANFDETVKSGVVLVDFWAPWCGPCRTQGPILDELAKEVGKGVVIGKVNVDENPELALKYEIRPIPALIVFKDGEVKQRMVGVHQKEELIQIIEAAKK